MRGVRVKFYQTGRTRTSQQVLMLLPDPDPAHIPHDRRGTSSSPVSLQIRASVGRAAPPRPSTPEGSVERRSHLGPQSTYLDNRDRLEGFREAPDSRDERARRHIETPGRGSRGGRARGGDLEQQKKRVDARRCFCDVILYGGFGSIAHTKIRFHGNTQQHHLS